MKQFPVPGWVTWRWWVLTSHHLNLSVPTSSRDLWQAQSENDRDLAAVLDNDIRTPPSTPPSKKEAQQNTKNNQIDSIYHLYTTYILPIGLL